MLLGILGYAYGSSLNQALSGSVEPTDWYISWSLIPRQQKSRRRGANSSPPHPIEALDASPSSLQVPTPLLVMRLSLLLILALSSPLSMSTSGSHIFPFYFLLLSCLHHVAWRGAGVENVRGAGRPPGGPRRVEKTSGLAPLQPQGAVVFVVVWPSSGGHMTSSWCRLRPTDPPFPGFDAGSSSQLSKPFTLISTDATQHAFRQKPPSPPPPASTPLPSPPPKKRFSSSRSAT